MFGLLYKELVRYTTHAIASIRAVENALGINVPPNAEMVEIYMLGSLYIHDHIVHFYHLHAFDWVDVVNGLMQTL